MPFARFNRMEEHRVDDDSSLLTPDPPFLKMVTNYTPAQVIEIERARNFSRNRVYFDSGAAVLLDSDSNYDHA